MRLSRADRLHAAISATFEGFYSAIEEASFERRTGHLRLLFPSVPIPYSMASSSSRNRAQGIADSILEVEECGLPCGVQVRAARHPDVEQVAGKLLDSPCDNDAGIDGIGRRACRHASSDIEIVRVEDGKGLADAARVAAAGGGAPVEYMLALYGPGLLQLAGFAVYVGRVGGETVTTAMGYQTSKDVAIQSIGLHRHGAFALAADLSSGEYVPIHG